MIRRGSGSWAFTDSLENAQFSMQNCEYILREQNQVANCLAKQALHEKGDPQAFDDPPEIPRALLDRNKFLDYSYV
ncbi:hypothetical protein PVK06_048985 [Gossypium arboreum]|uniref:RNase H type-1 domain-containing protein n=1 Tax=Gossypium arboreum TaxID=29729 RepID=A0ABR0MHS5_GOSAR|nr:hypothetical protein PVK06_048985 [Gossypium arboreum]